MNPRRCSQLRQSHRGFTLPEVLATLVLVGIALPAVMTGVMLSLHAADDARKKVEATGLAQQKLNELTESDGNGESIATSGDFGADHPEFFWSATTSNVDTDLDEVHVRVSWNSRGRQRGIELASFAYTGTGPNPSGGIGTTAVSPARPPAGGGGR